MTDTPHLALTYIDPAQSQKHVTHNEALRALDAMVHLSVSDRNRLASPASPLDGARYLLGTGTTGAFATQDGKIATLQDGAWRFLTPRAGWRLFVEAESLFIVFDGTLWHDIGAHIKALDNLDHLGLGTAADASNPLSAKLNAMLFTARTVAETGTGDLRVKLNKEAVIKTVSQLYQTGYSGRAETGLMGDDRFRLKVSADGTTWRTSLDVDPATGIVNFPSGATGAALVWRGAWSAATAYVVNDTVSYSGSTYIALLAGTAQVPAMAPVYWGLVAQQGLPGPMGAVPANGLGFLPIGLAVPDLLAMTDPAGNRIFGVDALGAFLTNSLNVAGNAAVAGNLSVAGSFVPPLGTLPRAVPLLQLANGTALASVTVDRNGNVLAAEDYAGNLYDANGPVRPVAGIAPGYSFDAASGTNKLTDAAVIYMFLVWGQSLAQGSGQGSDVTFDTVALDPGYSLMFNSGVRPSGAACTSLVDLVEGTVPGLSKNSICARLGRVLQAEFLARFGVRQQMLFALAVSGGTSYPGLKKGSAVYAEALRLVAAAVALAKPQGKKIIVMGMPILHGESDNSEGTPRGEYMRDLLTFRQDIDADIKAITGQTLPVRFVAHVPVRPSSVATDARTPMAILDAMDRDANITAIGGGFFTQPDNSASPAHPSSIGFAQMGEWFGYAFKDILFGKGVHRAPRIEQAWWVNGTTINLQYTVPVTIDTSSTLVDDTAISVGHGLDFLDGSGAGPAIAAVALVASPVTIAVGASTVTLGGAGSGVGVAFNTLGIDRRDLLLVRNNGLEYQLDLKKYDTFDGAATAMAALIPGATASGLVITIAAPVGLSAAVYSDQITVTLSGVPTARARPRLFCATRSTGAATWGPLFGARTTIRYPAALGTSATPGTPKLYNWALAQVKDLPNI